MTVFVGTIILIALLFDFLNGLNDAANSIATIVSAVYLRRERRCCGPPFRIYHETAAGLFSGHDRQLEKLKLKEIIGGLEWATDRGKRLANPVQHVVLKYA